VRFLSQHTLSRKWTLFDLLRVKMPRTLPLVLSLAEVRTILTSVRLPVRRMALTTIYALGLRLGEALRLEKTDILGDRLQVSIRDGKGAKDRTIPMPRPLLFRLRHYWKHERPPSPTPYLFLEPGRHKPFDESTLQKTLTAVRTEIGLTKHATIHTLRHSIATHLLENGVSLRTVQMFLGHKSLRTTERYLHVTKPSIEHLQRTLDRLTANLV
jgi:site-specific recombinase XerD